MIYTCNLKPLCGGLHYSQWIQRQKLKTIHSASHSYNRLMRAVFAPYAHRCISIRNYVMCICMYVLYVCIACNVCSVCMHVCMCACLYVCIHDVLNIYLSVCLSVCLS